MLTVKIAHICLKTIVAGDRFQGANFISDLKRPYMMSGSI